MDESLSPLIQQELPLVTKWGSTLIIPIYYKDADGDVIDLTDYAAKLFVRSTPEAEDPPDIELTTENGGIQIEEILGKITLKFLSAETIALDPNYRGTWDLFLIPAEATAFCLISGTFTVLPSNTRL